MRTTILFCGLGGCALLAGAVLAADDFTPPNNKKKDDGPGMTFNQKVGSLFGLIDRGSYEPPPLPPGMPPMNARGPVRVPAQGNTYSNTATGNNAQRSSFQPSANNMVRDPSLPQPPQPMRKADGTAVAAQAPRTLPSAPSNTARTMQQRQSVVGASKTPLFTTQPSVAQSVARSTTAANGWTSPNTPTAGAAAASKSMTAAAPKTTTDNGSLATKPFVSSRRKPTGETSVVESETPSLLAAPAKPAVTAPAASSSSGVAAQAALKPAAESPADPMMPAVPKLTTEAPAASSTSTVASAPITVSPSIATPAEPKTLPAPTAVATPQPPRPQTVVNAAAAPLALTQSGGEVLVSYTNPELTVETVGPRKVAVGRESSYRVVVRNRGNTEARDVVVSLQAPEHAEIAGLHGTSGHSTTADEFAAGTPLEWRLDLVSPKAQEELTLTLIPRRSESFELGVRWTSSTPVTRTLVEVEEPKLALAITGPNEVAFGEQRLFKLTVSNPGTGVAENVQLNLLPLSPSDGEAVRHTVGTLKPGESSIVEVELTARQAGALRIRTEASAEGNLRAEAAADVLVRRAVLEVAAVAPRMLFAGVPGNYEVRVRNSGDDAARNVRVSVDLPAGVKLLGAVPTTAGGKSNQLVWTFDRIAPGSEQLCTLKCAWDQGGKQQLNVTAIAAGDIQKTASASTDVQAVADLALDVADTAGPIPVGRPVTYEIRVKNRGLKSAEGVDVVAYFSEGIEPERAEGQTYEVQPGMCIFKTLPVVGPNQEKVLKVTAKAQTAGNHRIRVELVGANPQTQLSHEDATFFYVDDAIEPTAAPAPFQPQASSPIRATGVTIKPGAPQPVINAAAPQLRVNTIR